MALLPLKEYPFESKPMICAHRGDTSQGAAGNSISAIDAALATGAEMIEIDVQMTSDNILICHHDATLSNEDEKPIWQRTYSDLLAQTNSDALPTFEEVLRHAARKVYLNIEMKDYSGFHPSRFVHPLVDLVRRYGMHEYSLYSSFRFDFVQALPWDSLSVIIRPTSDIIAYFNERSISPVMTPKPVEEMLPSEIMHLAHATSFACMLSEIDSRAFADIKMHNIFLSIYTATSTEDFSNAIDKGAKAVVTDIPRELIAFRNSNYSS
ncbi:MAG: glycerophosphodiester phosphodiesterase [Bacteroidota bacterium]|nr:glycerophosphodiester phosphodiesterase [Bacteroidota bacterium]MDP4229738.1 glycerophosphodiester phosphodiesterase [Bacteroidota bacterium]MDP4235882.1 glycerophosphodiester phosphodiesterase [Bacteroidota bacterium]